MGENNVNIDNGSYFVEARKWYNEMFLRPAIMNAVMRLFCYVILVVTVMSLLAIHHSFPLNSKVTIIARLQNTSQYYPVIRKLKDSDGVRAAVVKYLAEKYIKSREIYSPEFFSQDYYFVQRSSQKQIFENYYNSLKDSTNTGLEFFKKGYDVEIHPLSSAYDAKNNQIIITFEKKIISKQKKVKDKMKFKATMKFYMSKYDFSHSVTKQLDFIVTDYKIEELKE